MAKSVNSAPPEFAFGLWHVAGTVSGRLESWFERLFRKL